MRFPAREEVDDLEDYFAEVYDMHPDIFETLCEFFAESLNNYNEAVTLETAFTAMLFAYEIGRTHEAFKRGIEGDIRK